jgi:peptide/nickel transport system permease protein
VLLAFSVGTPLGLVAGYVGGLVDTVVMRLTDILMTFPGMLLALVFVAVLGVGATNVTIAIGVATVPIFVRMVRGSVLVVKHLEFVQSARALGARAARIMGRHVLPNIVGPIVILATLRMATAILTAAALSFIGLGVQPPVPEWGAMLAEGKAYLRVAPHVVVFPGITIMVVVLAFNLMGDGLRDALDPSTTIEGRTDS